MWLASITQAQEDAWELSLAAKNAVTDTVLANAEKYPDRPWVRQTEDEHIDHAVHHLEDSYPPSDEDLEHAITRLCMALWLRQMESGSE